MLPEKSPSPWILPKLLHKLPVGEALLRALHSSLPGQRSPEKHFRVLPPLLPKEGQKRTIGEHRGDIIDDRRCEIIEDLSLELGIERL